MTKHLLFTIFIIQLLLFSGCITGVDQSSPKGMTDFEKIESDKGYQKKIKDELRTLHDVEEKDYVISAGDEFYIYVYDNEDLTTKGVIVAPDGTISMELAGVVEIGGKTIPEATKAIEDKLAEFIIHPKVTLVPSHIKSSQYTIVGAVVNPGVFEIKSGYRITDAIANSQGFMMGERKGDSIEIANLERSFIVRDKKVLPVSFVDIIKNGDFLNNIPIQNGDYIYIPSSMNLAVYVLGQVWRPGSCGYSDDLTFLKAISWAQGRTNKAGPEALVIRGDMVHPDIYKIDIEDTLKGRAPDFKLKPNDLVYIPTGDVDDYNLAIEQIIPTFVLLNLLTKPIAGAIGGGGI